MVGGIQEAAGAFAEALERGDAFAAAGFYAENGRLLTPAADLISGRAEIEAYWRAGIAVGLSNVELQPLELDVGCGIAIEIGRYAIALGRNEHRANSDRGKYLALHRLQKDGTWRRAIDVFNPDVPGTARHTIEEE
jgi:ketosteroid isomerase-like protein